MSIEGSLIDRLVDRWGRRMVIGTPYIFLILVFSIPFLVVLKISVSTSNDGIRFEDLSTFNDWVFSFTASFQKYRFLFTDDLYLNTYGSSLKFATINTFCCLFIGYPFAYFMARSPVSIRPVLLMLVSLPFWTSYLLRVYAWKGLLDDSGTVNSLLLWLGVIDEPMKMMYTAFSLSVGMVYTYLPFMILPLYANLVKMDGRLIEAANDLGASPFRAFWLVTVPLSKNGIIAGSMLVFIPSVGEYVIPELLGGPETLMIGRVLWDEFFSNNDWSMASAVAVVMVILILFPLALFNKYQTSGVGRGVA